MRLAFFNLENLFSRAVVLNSASAGVARSTLDAFSRFNRTIAKATYTTADKTLLVKLLGDLGLAKSDDAPLVRLRQNRGKFLIRRKGGTLDIVADGRSAWSGSLELEREPVDDIAMRMTAQVLRDVGADVQAICEAESRPALKAFSDELLPAVGAPPFPHVMLIDGNDTRGIDCALMSGARFPIGALRSHVDDADAEGPVFSRDCPEFHIEGDGGGLLVLVNHFKSKIGAPKVSDARRRRQAETVAAIYRARRAEGIERIAVVGDLNDTPPDSADDPLAPLLRDTDLRDVSTLPGHQDGGFPGTYDGGTARNKIDYILLSPALHAVAGASGVFRRGVWPGVRPRKWDVYEELDPLLGGLEAHAASDHAAIWVDLDLDQS